MPTADPHGKRRVNDGRDREGLRHVVVGFAIFFSGLSLLFGADIVGVERRLTTAMVVGLNDIPTKHGGHECHTVLTTGYGYAKIFTPNFCRFVSWHIGDKAEVEARQLRFTRTIVVSTRNTIFQGASTVLPES